MSDTGSLRLRPLGRTGLELPELGMGAMDTPDSTQGAATVAAALNLGLRFIDTARDYAGSELLLGEVFRTHGRGEAFVASKTFSRSIHGSQWDIDKSLAAMGIDFIDLYQLHDVRTPADWAKVTAPDGALAGLRIARERGLIGQIGVSTHNLDLAREIIESGAFATIMLDYSAFAPESAPMTDLASEHGVGVIVMRPLGGYGRTSILRRNLAGGYDGPLTPANLLRYVLSNPGVSVAIPGMSYPDRVHANWHLATTYQLMPESERRELERLAREMY